MSVGNNDHQRFDLTYLLTRVRLLKGLIAYPVVKATITIICISTKCLNLLNHRRVWFLRHCFEK